MAEWPYTVSHITNFFELGIFSNDEILLKTHRKYFRPIGGRLISNRLLSFMYPPSPLTE